MINLPGNQESTSSLNQLVSVIRSFANYLSTAVDISGRQRITLDGANTLTTVTGVTTVTTVTGVTTVSTVSNQTQVGGYNASDQIPALMNINAYNLRANIAVTGT